MTWQPIPHEGGWYRPGPRTDQLSSITARFDSSPDGFSAFHRLTVTEGWQWLAGDPLEVVQLHPDGTATSTTLDAADPQAVVAPGTWLAARTTGAESVVGCWCSPPFTDDAFELARRDDLLASHPEQASAIDSLTRS